jgi:DNA polymerase-1
MSILELARKVYNRLKAQRNGHCHPPTLSPLVARAVSNPLPESHRACEGDQESLDTPPQTPEESDAEPKAALREKRDKREKPISCGESGESHAYAENAINVKSPSPYQRVTSAAELSTVLQAVDESERVGLDIETTGLDPRRDRVRLLQLATARGLFVLDLFVLGDVPSLWGALAEKTLLGHNLGFDLRFLAGLGFEPGAVADTMLLSQLLHGTRKARGFHTLQETAAREIGRTLDKSLQGSDWSAELSREQLDYAAEDVAVLGPLYDDLTVKIAAAGMARVAAIEQRCLPAMVWLAGAGVSFDRSAWLALTDQAERDVEELSQRLDAQAPPRDEYLSEALAWKWSSPQQVRAAFPALGIRLTSTDDDALAAVTHPLAELLRQYRSATKRAETYGKKWLQQHVADDDRVYAAFHQIGADTGRMACTQPNLQNIPKDPAYRRCFRAPDGRVLIRCDYSQIELRIACRIANERRMREAYRAGADLHRLTAQKMTGRAEVTKEERGMAKPVNFGMIYGLSPDGLRRKAKSEYGLDLSKQDASRFRDAFFKAWPDIQRWHNTLRSQNPSEVSTLAGRRLRLPGKRHFGMAANYSVQGTGSDGVKAALGLLWERRAACPGARPVLVVHDEIVVEAGADQAEAAAAWLKAAMVDGMAPLIEPVPVDVEVKMAPTWGG